jgi:hypothetical protein
MNFAARSQTGVCFKRINCFCEEVPAIFDRMVDRGMVKDRKFVRIKAAPEVDSSCAPDEDPEWASPEVEKLAKKIYEIGAKGIVLPKWKDARGETVTFCCQVAKWHLGEIYSLALVAKGAEDEAERSKGELSRVRAAAAGFPDLPQKNAKGKEKARSGFVFCREPMPGSSIKKPRYASDAGAGGWTNDPRKAQVFLSMAHAKRANSHGEKIVPLEKAIRRFEAS